MLVHSPIKKNNYYCSRITTDAKKVIKLRIPHSIIKNYLSLSNRQGYLIDIRVPLDDFALEKIHEMEDTCVKEMISKNKEWFENSLSEDKIHKLFESCVSSKEFLRVYASNVRSIGIKTDESRVDIDDWLLSIKKKMPAQVCLTIVCDGMFIYPDKFGLRWVIGEICEYVEPEDITPNIDEIVVFLKEKAEQNLQEVIKTKQSFLKKIANLDKEINTLKNIVQNINENNYVEFEKHIENTFS